MLKVIVTAISVMFIILVIWKALDDSDYLGLMKEGHHGDMEAHMREMVGMSREEKKQICKKYRRWIWQDDDK